MGGVEIIIDFLHIFGFYNTVFPGSKGNRGIKKGQTPGSKLLYLRSST